MEIPGFVEEIDYNELHFLQIVGRGAFGVVSRARWRSIDVAVKLIETESERKAFITELKQLSRISHPNIVRLYGASTRQPVCLVMEFAEGGSLYSVLHGKPPFPHYTAAHALSWTLQCARGVEYLHAMKPKPLIHRDLKPPNLLLISGGTVLKICDFGTACDAHTHMTNNKGSAAWMAPEVFEGCNYSEKCDVFSWGIILWEVITRHKPFDEIGGSAFRVMWAVHSGKRPPLVKDCPKCLENMMTRCWSVKPAERPSMSEIVRVMTSLSKLFPGGDEPLVYSNYEIDDTVCSTPAASQMPAGSVMFDSHATVHETMRRRDKDLAAQHVPFYLLTTPSRPIVIEDDKGHISAPSSTRGSSEGLGDAGEVPAAASVNDMLSVPRPVPPVRRHRRTVSYGTIPVSVEQQLVPPGYKRHQRTGSTGSIVVMTTASSSIPTVAGSDIILPTITTASQDASLIQNPSITGAAHSVSWTPDMRPQVSVGDNVEEPGLDKPHLLDPQLMPLKPCTTCSESVEIYDKHCALVEDYVQLQAEIIQLEHRKQQLFTELQIDEREQHNRLKEEYSSLLTENDELKLLHNNLLMQVEHLKAGSPQH